MREASGLTCIMRWLFVSPLWVLFSLGNRWLQQSSSLISMPYSKMCWWWCYKVQTFQATHKHWKYVKLQASCTNDVTQNIGSMYGNTQVANTVEVYEHVCYIYLVLISFTFHISCACHIVYYVCMARFSRFLGSSRCSPVQYWRDMSMPNEFRMRSVCLGLPQDLIWVLWAWWCSTLWS